MSYIRYPSCYKDFQCTASACSDSCCIGWEIDIDQNTWEKYRQVEGKFGKRLQDNIQVIQEGESVCACFRMDETQRCPFLNNQNLCDIILKLGEEYLGQICTDHPRFYDWFLDGKECGIGLCCEEAARLILQPDSGFWLEETGEPEGFWKAETVPEEAAESDQACEDGADFLTEIELERELEQKLFGMREVLFKELSGDNSLMQKMDSLYDIAYQMQDEYDAWLFPEDEWDEIEDCQEFPGWQQTFWQEDFLSDVIDFYLDLEINKDEWRRILQEAKGHISEILIAKSEFFKMYQGHLYEYVHLLYYFIYRHFMSARRDDEVAEKVIFALVSTSVIQLMDIWFWMKSGKKKFVQKEQIAICKLYSQEIEYHEENMNKVAGCMKFLEK